jgi:hypothetical protein
MNESFDVIIVGTRCAGANRGHTCVPAFASALSTRTTFPATRFRCIRLVLAREARPRIESIERPIAGSSLIVGQDSNPRPSVMSTAREFGWTTWSAF